MKNFSATTRKLKKKVSNTMKKILILAIATVMLLCFTACNQEQPNDVPQITMGAQTNNNVENQNTAETTGEAVTGEPFAFTWNNVKLIPGAAFDASKLPEATSTYEVPSCALEGTDNVYNYDTFEVTAYNEGKGEYIYSIYLIDPNLTTPEGLALGDDLAKAVSLYGDNYTQEDTAYIYESAKTQLVLLLQDDAIVSIEYRLVTE